MDRGSRSWWGRGYPNDSCSQENWFQWKGSFHEKFNSYEAYLFFSCGHLQSYHKTKYQLHRRMSSRREHAQDPREQHSVCTFFSLDCDSFWRHKNHIDSYLTATLLLWQLIATNDSTTADSSATHIHFCEGRSVYFTCEHRRNLSGGQQFSLMQDSRIPSPIFIPHKFMSIRDPFYLRPWCACTSSCKSRHSSWTAGSSHAMDWRARAYARTSSTPVIG